MRKFCKSPRRVRYCGHGSNSNSSSSSSSSSSSISSNQKNRLGQASLVKYVKAFKRPWRRRWRARRAAVYDVCWPDGRCGRTRGATGGVPLRLHGRPGVGLSPDRATRIKTKEPEESQPIGGHGVACAGSLRRRLDERHPVICCAHPDEKSDQNTGRRVLIATEFKGDRLTASFGCRSRRRDARPTTFSFISVFGQVFRADSVLLHWRGAASDPVRLRFPSSTSNFSRWESRCVATCYVVGSRVSPLQFLLGSRHQRPTVG